MENGSYNMKILSISVNVVSLKVPDTFILGQKPIISQEGEVVDSPKISNIKFFETSSVYTKVYRGATGFYVIEFEGSSVKRIIPEREVIDVAVETAEKQNMGTKLPDLSGE